MPGHNLPVQLTTFVGRQREVDEIRALVRETRLVTLVGPGGSGKTRLALQAAAGIVDEHPDGVWLVELDALREPALVPHAVAAAIGLRDRPDRTLDEALPDVLRERRLLIVLDNCEHLAGACAALVTSMLRAAPDVGVLATSREPLGVAGEMRWRVPPLAESDAVALFVERARLAGAREPGADDAAAVCKRLDGLPLAIELAAARAGVLDPRDIAARLLDALPSPVRDAPERQRTLRGAIGWSWTLLSSGEQLLLARLAVFGAPFALADAEEVCGADAAMLLGLVDRSLVAAEGHGRYRLFDTVRRYAREALPDETAGARDRLRGWCVALAERAAEQLRGPAQREWLERLDAAHDHFREVLAFDDRPDESLRLSAALAPFWEVRGHLSQGRLWLEAALGRGGDRGVLRARALLGAASLARVLGDYEGARAFAEEALGLVRASGDTRAIAESLSAVGSVAFAQGDVRTARSLSTDSVALVRELGDRRSVAEGLSALSAIAWTDGDLDAARALHEQALALSRESGDTRAIADALLWLGNLAWATDDPDAARARYEEAVALVRTDRRRYADALTGLGAMTRDARVLQEALRIRRELGHRRGVAVALVNLAGVTGDSALLDEARRIAEELGDERIAQAARGTVPPAPAASPPGSLRHQGEYWSIVFDGRETKLRDSKGLRHIANLLRYPGREWHVLDLVAAEEGTDVPVPTGRAAGLGAGRLGAEGLGAGRLGDAGELLDAQARAAYRQRLQDLDDELAEAQEWGDTARATKLRAEIDALTEQLAAAMGLGGRNRKVSSASERARWSVSRSIHSALDRIQDADEPLGAHLAATVKTGTFCVYAPDPRAPMRWEVSA